MLLEKKWECFRNVTPSTRVFGFWSRIFPPTPKTLYKCMHSSTGDMPTIVSHRVSFRTPSPLLHSPSVFFSSSHSTVNCSIYTYTNGRKNKSGSTMFLHLDTCKRETGLCIEMFPFLWRRFPYVRKVTRPYAITRV